MKPIILTERMLLGNVAKMAVQQSPYPRPDNLEVVLDKLYELTKEDFKDYIIKFDDRKSICKFIHDKLAQIPEYIAWNDRKNGNSAPYKFISRYDTDNNPDDDFIDLDALEMNVYNEIIKED